MPLLANASVPLTSLLVPLAILIVIVGLLLGALSVVRRRMKSEDVTPRDFTLTELRDLHRQGKLTDEEFDRAKSLMVGKVHSKLAKEVKPTMAAEPLNAELKSEDTRRS